MSLQPDEFKEEDTSPSMAKAGKVERLTITLTIKQQGGVS